MTKAISASKTLRCDDPQDQDEDTCELLSLAISDFALNGYVVDVPSSSKGGKGKESSKFDSINMSSMTKAWEDSSSDWSLETKTKALVSTLSLASIILKEMMDDDADEMN